MLWSVEQLHRYPILATNGQTGEVDEFYFDDEEWMIRYLVIDIGKWLSGQRVLISPNVLGQPRLMTHVLPVMLTQSQINDSPDIDRDKPVCRQPKVDYWPGLGIPASLGVPGSYASTQSVAEKDEEHKPDPHLRSTKEVVGYHIQATDGEIGHVEDFIIDDETWIVRYLVVNTRNWLPGRKVLLAPRWVNRVSWLGSKVFVGLPRASIKDKPAYDLLALARRESRKPAFDRHGWTQL
jgi:sporulation protein YlmC with PRC-barrel domain